MARKTKRETQTGDLFDPSPRLVQELRGLDWPPGDRFPLNNVDGFSVGDRVVEDLWRSDSPLIVTGYASLTELVQLTARITQDPREREPDVIRLLLGSEPNTAGASSFGTTVERLPVEIRNYWLEHGVSPALSADIIATIEAIKAGRLRARTVDEYPVRMHAKVYAGDEAATLGSSNFTKPGLRSQIEANVRFCATGTQEEASRYRQTRWIAENLWKLGRDYTSELLDLLQQLLRVVSWQEALARACNELLTGAWAQDYLRFYALGEVPSLWPLQQSGIAQAMYLLDQAQSVLVADPTGSGKTRMGAQLLRAQMNKVWSQGQRHKGNCVVICPPMVAPAWNEEALACHLPIHAHSHGKLSHASAADEVLGAVRRAQILAVDEAHNFLNLYSNRTRKLLGNIADHLVLLTATPINRSTRDLLHLVDILGADNFDDQTNATIEALAKAQQVRQLSDDDRAFLRAQIRRFTVRRTKPQIKQLIARTPEAYRDRHGRPCQYPEHVAKVYRLDESERDRALATQIRGIAGQLIGVTHFDKALEMPGHMRKRGRSPEAYLSQRLNAAAKLAAYQVHEALRSSRAALIEHVEGTDAASKFAQLAQPPPKTDSGNLLAKLNKVAGKPPKNKLEVDVPDWLKDADAHRQACADERARYQAIARLARGMSDGREQRKALKLLKLAAKHDRVIAFDAKPISLCAIAYWIARDKPRDVELAIATGSDQSDKAAVVRAFHPDSDSGRAIALCSDALSEGINLQRASAMMHLDMPSVIRVAEQRVGRVDRLDSLHKRIEAWWPLDAPEFALRRDERFRERFATVDELLGSNMQLPNELDGRPASPQDLIEDLKALEREDLRYAEDAFSPVRDLQEGPTALIPPDIVQQMDAVAAQVLARVSLVRAKSPWAFLCLRGTASHAPKWIFYPDPDAAPVTDLAKVAQLLRDHLEGADNVDADPHAMAVVTRFIDRLGEGRKALLSVKKQRLLDELLGLLKHYARHPAYADVEHQELLNALNRGLRAHDADGLDLNDAAEAWMDLIRPVWFDALADSKRVKPLRLKDLRKRLRGEQIIKPDALRVRFAQVGYATPLDGHVAACIVGVNPPASAASPAPSTPGSSG